MGMTKCMASLNLGGKIADTELRDTAAEYVAKGMDRSAAMIRAVSEKLEMSQMEERQIVKTVRTAYEAKGGKPRPVPVKAEPEPPLLSGSRKDLPLAELRNFKTGKPVSFEYVRNTEKAPKLKAGQEDTYAQRIEPAGRYMNEKETSSVPDHLETGSVKFENPLVIEHGEGYSNISNWKRQLSAAYGGKTGRALSMAILKDGHDGIVTIGRHKSGDHTSEIIDLRVIGEPTTEPRNLLLQHNLTERNILHADRMGGIAVPSLAVTRKEAPMTNFGEITLIGSRDMADPKGYAKTKVFGADIYSPRYPSVKYQVKSRDVKAMNESLAKHAEQTGARPISADDLESDPLRHLENNGAVLAKFLEMKGIKPEIKKTEPTGAMKTVLANQDVFKPFMASRDYQDLMRDPAFQDAVIKQQRDQLIDAGIPATDRHIRSLDSLDASQRINYAREPARAIADLHNVDLDNLGPDRVKSEYAMADQIRAAGLDDEYHQYLSDQLHQLNPDEKVYAGQTASGNRKYVPHSLENVVKILKKELRGGENFNYGVGTIRAKYTPEFKSIKDIQVNRDKLVSSEAFEKVKEEIGNEFTDIGQQLRDHHPASDRFGFMDTVSMTMYDAATMGIPRALHENGFDEVPEAVQVEMRDFLSKLRTMPTEYFEAKIMRDVHLSEFSGAVIPHDTSRQVRAVLKKHGLKTMEYDRSDQSAHGKAIEQFGDQLHDEKGGILFSTGRTIEVDGERRPIENSEGRQVADTFDKQKAFYDWFGKSAVVDDKGRPLTMYHGTSNAGFDSFDTYASNYGLMGMGGYFTADPNVASSYTAKGRGDAPGVYKTYLSIKHPIDMDGPADAEKWKAQFDGIEHYHEGGDKNESWYRAAEDMMADQEMPKWEGAEAMQDGLRGMGYDGITHVGGGRVAADSVRHRVYVAFDPEQVKSATGNAGSFDPKNADIRYSSERDERQPMFYSQLGRTIDQVPAKVDNTSAASWKGWLLNNAAKMGVKADEIKWSGITDYLDLMGKQKLSKDQIKEYLAQNGVKVDEVQKGSTWAVFDPMEREEYYFDTEREARAYASENNIPSVEVFPKEGWSGAPKYSQYVLPGGENYRELLLTLPSKRPAINAELSKANEAWQDALVEHDSNSSEVRALKAERDRLSAEFEKAPADYRSSHWDEGNILAHVRFNDRTDAEGKRVLLIEELQSDWGQDGLKHGFKSADKDALPEGYSLVDDSEDARKNGIPVPAGEVGPWLFRGPSGTSRVFKTREEATTAAWRDAKNDGKEVVQSAPFVTDTKAWLSLGIKRMIRYAAENGYDKVAFANGEQSADRYDLSKSLDSVDVRKNGDMLTVYASKDNENVLTKMTRPDKLDEVIGKELADRVLKDLDAGRSTQYHGMDLKVGGEGMKAFYDKIVPQTANDVLKRLGGGKVGAVTLPRMPGGKTVTMANGHQVKTLGDIQQTGFDITPELRAKALDGMPLFSQSRNPLGADYDGPGADLVSQSKSALREIVDDVLMKVSPMSLGTDVTRAVAKTWANNDRLARSQWALFDHVLKKEYTDEQRTAMWEAADEENVLRMTGKTAPGMGLDRLPADQRATMETLHAYGESLLQRARDVGMFKGEGLPFWTPRMATLIGDDGEYMRVPAGEGGSSSTAGRNVVNSAPSLKQRKYLTAAETEAAMKAKFGDSAKIVRDIRTMPLAMARLERAIAGRELVNQIKDLGIAAGVESVSSGSGPNFFTLDHPAFKTYKPRMTTENVDPNELAAKDYFERDGQVFRRVADPTAPGLSREVPLKSYSVAADGTITHTVPLLDQNGQPVFDQVPIFISKDFEGPLRAIMSDTSGKAYQAFMGFKSKTMGLIMYSPLIHNAVEWGRAMPMMPGKVLTFAAYMRGNSMRNGMQYDGYFQKVYDGVQGLPGARDVLPRRAGKSGTTDYTEYRQAIKDGMVPIGNRGMNQDLTAMMNDPDLMPGRSWTAKLIGGAVGLVNEEAGTGTKKVIDKAGEIWHQALLWDRVADLQAGIYSYVKADMVKKGMDENAAGKLAAHFANRYAGALPNEAMSVNARKIANFVLFSRSFTIGNLGVMKDIFTGMPKDVAAQIRMESGEAALKLGKSVGRRKAAMAFALDVALMYAGNSLLQDALDHMRRDKSLDAILQGYADRMHRLMAHVQENPFALLDPLEHLTSTSENEPGKEDRIHFDNEPGGTSVYLRLPTGKIGEEFKGWLTSPLQMLMRKQGTVMRPITQLIENDKGFGRRVYDPDATGPAAAMKNLGRIAWNFIAQQYPADSVRSVGDMMAGKADPTDKLKAIGPLVGLTFSKGAPGGPAVGMQYAIERKHQGEVMDVMPDVQRAIKQGDTDGALQMMRDAKMTPSEMLNVMKRNQAPATRINQQSTKKFNQRASEEDKEKMSRLRGQ